MKKIAPPRHLVAIIGRPNVGKSTLFNRIIGEKKAILSDVPGTTRDVLFGTVTWQGKTFTLADTAGLEPDNKSEIAESVFIQTQIAIENSDLIIFAVNAQDGIHPDDRLAADLIRKSGKPVVMMINKTDNKKAAENASEFTRIGFKHIFLTSGLTGKGIGDTLDEVLRQLSKIKKPKVEKTDSKYHIKVAIVGRPNAGKSTLFNKLIGKRRSVVSPVGGTTRDAINEQIIHGDYTIEFIDTAGLRRRGKVEMGIEKFSALKVLRSVQDADICLVVMEATVGVIAQDAHVLQIVLENAKSPVLVVNKWDAIEKDYRITADYEKYLESKYKFVTWMPKIYVSALNGQRVEKIKDLVVETWASRTFEFPIRDLDRLVLQAVTDKPLHGRHSSPQIFEAKQISTNPPTIQLRTNKSAELHPNHFRYIENVIRKTWPLIGTPINFTIKGIQRAKDQ
jgi:GTP-binding protein